MAAVVFVEDIVKEAKKVRLAASTRFDSNNSRHCSMNKASTSMDAPAAMSGRKLGKKRSRVCAKSLFSLKDRKKLGKAVVKRVKRVSLTALTALKARRVRAKIDKDYDPEIEEYMREFKSRKARRLAILEEGAQFIDQVENLAQTAREMREQAEKRQTIELAFILSQLIPSSQVP